MKTILTKFIISTLAGGLWLSGFALWAATPWEFVPAKGQLRAHLEKSDWPQAFADWQVNFAPTAYSQSPNGRALYAVILTKNGMTTEGFESLFQVQKPSQIDVNLKNILKSELSSENPLWIHADYKWKKEWQSVFGNDLEQRREAVQNVTLKSNKEFKAAEQLLERSQKHSPEWARMHWQLATSRAIQNQIGPAAKHLRALLESKQSTIGRDQIVMALARLEFQAGRMDEALKVYSQISKSSDYWLEALEEKAWAHIRKKDYRKALADLQTLLSPVFAAELGPEPYLVSSFANLKICDFESIFKNHDLFKTRYRARTEELQKLAKTGQSAALSSALERLRAGATRWSELGSEVEKLPRFLHRDREITSLVNRSRALSAERVQMSNMTAQVQENFAATHLGDQLSKSLSAIDGKQAGIQNAINRRVKILAQNDLDETARILQKLQLVEAESIQRLHLYANNERGESDFDDKGGGDRIVFPQDSEVWLDELDNYQVKAAGCPELGRKGKLAKKGE